MKFRPNVTLLEDRWNPSTLLGSDTPPPPNPYDPSAPPAQQQPVTPVPPGSDPFGPGPGYPGG